MIKAVIANFKTVVERSSSSGWLDNSLLVLLFSKSISDKIIGKPYLQIEIIIGAFMLLFNAINASQIGILSGFQKYKVIAVNSLVAVLLSFPIQIFG